MALKIVDSYGEGNYNNVSLNAYSTSGGDYEATAQSFTGNGTILDHVLLYLRASDDGISGDVNVSIYAHSGTFGTSSILTGVPLATSESVSASLIQSYGLELIRFNFYASESPAMINRIMLESGTKYVLAIWSTTDYDSGEVIYSGRDTLSPNHGGNISYHAYDGGPWIPSADHDLIFYVYGVSPSPLPTHFNL